MTNEITNAISGLLAKPAVGASTSTLSLILFWLHIIGPVIAFVGIVFGTIAAIYSFFTKRAEYRRATQELHDLRVKDGLEK